MRLNRDYDTYAITKKNIIEKKEQTYRFKKMHRD